MFYYMKKVVFILFLFYTYFTKISFSDNLFQVAEDFILKNEVSGVWRLKAYKDTKWTICNGITYYIVKNKMKGGSMGHKCKPIDKNQLNKGYVCKVKKDDLLLLTECKKQSKIHIDYIINKLSNKLLIGKSKRNYWNTLTIYQQATLIDIIFNYGETNKQVKKVLEATMELQNNKTKYNKIAFYKANLDLCEMSWYKKKYQKGQDKRCNKRIALFFNE